jgi:hypothetical protein
MPVPYIFAGVPGGTTIPLSQLDADFAYLANGNNFGPGVFSVLQLGVNVPGGLMIYPSGGGTGDVLTLNSLGVPFWDNSGPASTVAISNDTSTNTNQYPLFADVTTGVATQIYTSNPKYRYNPASGNLTAPRLVCSSGISLSAQAITASYTLDAGYNGFSVGPITIAPGVVITVPPGAAWAIV